MEGGREEDGASGGCAGEYLEATCTETGDVLFCGEERRQKPREADGDDDVEVLLVLKRRRELQIEGVEHHISAGGERDKISSRKHAETEDGQRDRELYSERSPRPSQRRNEEAALVFAASPSSSAPSACERRSSQRTASPCRRDYSSPFPCRSDPPSGGNPSVAKSFSDLSSSRLSSSRVNPVSAPSLFTRRETAALPQSACGVRTAQPDSSPHAEADKLPNTLSGASLSSQNQGMQSIFSSHEVLPVFPARPPSRPSVSSRIPSSPSGSADPPVASASRASPSSPGASLLSPPPSLPAACPSSSSAFSGGPRRATHRRASHGEEELVAPDLHALFAHYNDAFFEGKLAGVEVRWSRRMTLCAGLCVYQAGGYCSVRLSEPLLKFRSVKEFRETLLHEMIHAFLFVTKRDREHDAHGPDFLAHMHRLNALTGLNITVFHTFHDEVDYYRTHIWRCQGKCRETPPYFGYVRRSMNRAPGPYDRWWADHQQACGGTYVKISEPKALAASRKASSSRSGKSAQRPPQKSRSAAGAAARDTPAAKARSDAASPASAGKPKQLGLLDTWKKTGGRGKAESYAANTPVTPAAAGTRPSFSPLGTVADSLSFADAVNLHRRERLLTAKMDGAGRAESPLSGASPPVRASPSSDSSFVPSLSPASRQTQARAAATSSSRGGAVPSASPSSSAATSSSSARGRSGAVSDDDAVECVAVRTSSDASLSLHPSRRQPSPPSPPPSSLSGRPVSPRTRRRDCQGAGARRDGAAQPAEEPQRSRRLGSDAGVSSVDGLEDDGDVVFVSSSHGDAAPFPRDRELPPVGGQAARTRVAPRQLAQSSFPSRAAAASEASAACASSSESGAEASESREREEAATSSPVGDLSPPSDANLCRYCGHGFEGLREFRRHIQCCIRDPDRLRGRRDLAPAAREGDALSPLPSAHS
ncbi:SprT domain-containing protein [Besnoitia besnoiti]|uniref:SprT domain-containing protein n=1 Tax=Besnoitia besnoiti TaxID=94643 RepID=A0A2A9MNZ7_BESBE|nr:SprT domain-containing protein [Besnoitia besnoiti]PFH38331.1 SprT domain-containing protein [Besnoitia besnoiti]